MLTASLIAAIKSSSVQMLGHAGHDVRRAIRVGPSAGLWDMIAIMVKGFANQGKLHAVVTVRQTYRALK